MRAALVALTIVASLAPARAQPQSAPLPANLPPNLPQIVKDAIAGNSKACEDGARPVLKPGFLATKDINGDGKPDFILDYEYFQCGELGSLFCGSAGCLTEVFASDDEGGYVAVWNENVRRIRFATVKKRPAMLIDLHGSACGRVGAAPCAMTLYWNGARFHPAN